MDFTYYPNRIALLDGGGRAIAEITFPDIDEDTVDINHTFVDESLRGRQTDGSCREPDPVPGQEGCAHMFLCRKMV